MRAADLTMAAKPLGSSSYPRPVFHNQHSGLQADVVHPVPHLQSELSSVISSYEIWRCEQGINRKEEPST